MRDIKVFKTQILLRKHISYNHGEEKKAFKCDRCNQTLQTKSALKFHTETVHEKKSHICPQCERPFSTKFTLLFNKKGKKKSKKEYEVRKIYHHQHDKSFEGDGGGSGACFM